MQEHMYCEWKVALRMHHMACSVAPLAQYAVWLVKSASYFFNMPLVSCLLYQNLCLTPFLIDTTKGTNKKENHPFKI